MTSTSGTGISALKSILDQPGYKARFAEILKHRAPQFCASIIQVARTLPANTDANSIVSSALMAATLDLPVNKDLGFAWIVPYKGQASFQLGYKGYVQLAQRSGQYENINVTEVYEGELEQFDRLTGRFKLSGKRTSEKVIGFAAYFRLVNGFEKQEYWSREEVEAHARRFSQGFRANSGPWKDDFDAMAMKTVLKHLLSKWGILSIELQNAVRLDQSIVRETPEGFEPHFPKEDRFANAAPAKPAEQPATDIPAEVVTDASSEPASEPAPAPAPQAAAPAAKAKPAAPAAPTGQLAAPTPEEIQKLKDMCVDKEITEGEICKWAQTAWKISPTESIDDMAANYPRRVTMLLRMFDVVSAEIINTRQ